MIVCQPKGLGKTDGLGEPEWQPMITHCVETKSSAGSLVGPRSGGDPGVGLAQRLPSVKVQPCAQRCWTTARLAPSRGCSPDLRLILPPDGARLSRRARYRAGSASALPPAVPANPEARRHILLGALPEPTNGTVFCFVVFGANVEAACGIFPLWTPRCERLRAGAGPRRRGAPSTAPNNRASP
ncbi:hypothetical protein AAFF_G00286190 [Aldrovandia affinis]|uniref:Uncharacterized protein n=1 Tax=Aldrovandia affinis TaxID=143900 RepID=A0AAD7TAI1_9TELE|nr:hypothetical protein AAFF_G00286190 [Aldrovandia affinis]